MSSGVRRQRGRQRGRAVRSRRLGSWSVAGVVLLALVIAVAARDRAPRRPPVPAPSPVGHHSPTAPAATGTDSAAATPVSGGGTAAALLARLPVKGRAPLTGYSRAQFGPAWGDVDHNGCNTRDDVLAAQLDDVVRAGTCRVRSGAETDPYTGRVLHYVRGHSTVDIDHVVALGDAWQTGAQQLTRARRTAFANDPLNLLAVSLSANRQKGDADAASWLPRRPYRCAYVARQVAVKAEYGLWTTRAEHASIGSILSSCPGLIAPTGAPARTSPAPGTTGPAPTPARSRTSAGPASTPASTQTSTPASTPPSARASRKRPGTLGAAPPAVVHPGSFCAPAGGTGVTDGGTPMVCGTASDGRNRWHRD